MERFNLETSSRTYKNCFFQIGRYLADNSFAVIVCNDADGPIACLTVCIPDSNLEGDEVALDTNNCPWVVDFIKAHNFGHPTGKTLKSGYCTYPVVILNIVHMIGYAQWEGGAER